MSPEHHEFAMLFHATIGMFIRFRTEVIRRIRDISPDEADWEEKLAEYLLGLPPRDQATLRGAVDVLRGAMRPMSGPEILGQPNDKNKRPVEQKKLNVLSDATARDVLKNKRGLGYYLPFWPLSMITKPK
jgi:hypothetical protein